MNTTKHQPPGPPHPHLVSLTGGFLADLADSPHPTPRLSLYQPTHRHYPENQQDPIRFRSLVKKLESSLRETRTADQTHALLEPFEELAQDSGFWNRTLDGLAVFAAADWFKVVILRRSVPELTVVADSFHTKPLRRYLQSADRFQVLGLNLHEMSLFEGDRHTLEALASAPGVPGTMVDALGSELTEPHQTVASYGGIGTASQAMHHGHGGRNDETENDAIRFFRAVDRAVLESHSRPTGLPLILATLPEHHHLFAEVSHNPFLMSESVKTHPDSLSLDQLRERAWEVFEPHYFAKLAEMASDFQVARTKGLGLEDLAGIGNAAVDGRVATLLIEADREIFGRIHTGTGNVHFEESDQASGDDLLDDLGEWVIRKGGQVFVIPADRMPTTTGAAATCRY